MTTKLLMVHALSPLYAGTGQGIGVIDLPIAREKATELPYVPGSSVKGVLRDVCRAVAPSECITVFGPESNNASAHAGSAQFGDCKLLLLPVRSVMGVFAWVTSPYLLKRLRRDAQNIGMSNIPDVPDVGAGACVVTTKSGLSLPVNNQQTVVLEDVDVPQMTTVNADDWSQWLGSHLFASDAEWAAFLNIRLCIVHDDILSFLMQTATEVIARNRLQDDTKTVAKGGLWYEEALPTETVLVSMITATPVEKTGKKPHQIHDVINTLIDKPVQIGGHATIGRGLCQLTIVEPSKEV